MLNSIKKLSNRLFKELIEYNTFIHCEEHQASFYNFK